MGVDPENIKVTVLILGSIGTKPMFVIKDLEKWKGSEGKFITAFHFSCYIYNKRGHKVMDFTTKTKRSNGGRMKTEIKQIALQDTLTLHWSAMKSLIQLL
jgi:hypothetical protein